MGGARANTVANELRLTSRRPSTGLDLDAGEAATGRGEGTAQPSRHGETKSGGVAQRIEPNANWFFDAILPTA